MMPASGSHRKFSSNFEVWTTDVGEASYRFYLLARFCFNITSFYSFLAHSEDVRRPSSFCLSVRPSVCKLFAQIASSTRQMARSPPNLHTMVSRRACIQGVLKVKVEVRGHVIRAL